MSDQESSQLPPVGHPHHEDEDEISHTEQQHPRQGHGAAATLSSPLKKTILPNRPRVYLSFPHNTAAPQNVLPGSLRVHPRGFRLLKGCSPLERRMNTYFRLPPRPTRHTMEQNQRLIKQLSKVFPPPGYASHTAPHRVALDGFILLEACGVQDPANAKECVLNDSNLSGSAEEDLVYFTSLRFLDIGENSMKLSDLRVLPALEELHLHCNSVSSLQLDKETDTGDEDSGEYFPRLGTLNLSFNSVPFREVTLLSQLRSLERLDLSANNLRHLPSDLSGLINVSQLALENNKFSDPQVLLALSTMPSLVEVNLNFNQFTSIPKLSVADGQGVCFPLLQVIGLASNNMEFFEDVFALTQLTTLRRVVLWGNPVERKMRDCEILIYEFGALQIQVVLESPIPPKRKTGEFYSANTNNFIRVTEKELKPIPKKGTLRKPHTAPTGTGAGSGSAENAEGGPSFFVTQVGIEQGGQGNQQAREDGATDPAGAEQGKGGRRRDHAAADDGWFASTPHDVETPSDGQRGSHFGGRAAVGVGGRDALRSATSDGGMMDPISHESPASVDAADWGPTPGSREDACRPNANVRAVMAELKRMLRQPLPPIHVPQFEQSTASRTAKRKT